MIRTLLLLALLLPSSFAFARGAGSPPATVVEVGDRTFYSNHGDLWVTDGTELGTNRVEPGGMFTVYSQVVAMKGKAYAVGSLDGRVGLYTTDGRSAKLVTALDGTNVSGLTASDSRLFFFIRSPWLAGFIRLIASDGTEEGTKPIAVLTTDDARPVAATGSRMLFRIYAPDRFEWKGRTEYELWSIDGTAEGTGRLFERVPGAFTRAGRLLYFHEGSSLHRTDGTPAGTFRLAASSRILGTHGSTLYFAAGKAVFKTDGTVEGTSDTGLRTTGSALFVLGPRTVVFADYGNKVEIHGTDGEALLQLVRTLSSGGNGVARFLQLGDEIFVSIATPESIEIWRTDGTSEGTVLLKALPRPAYRWTIDIHRAGGRPLFWLDDGVHGAEPWTTDGTSEGTRMIANTRLEGTIRGRATDAATGRPIGGVAIEIFQHGAPAGSVETDYAGRYLFEGMLGDQITVRARTSGAYIAETHGTTLRLAAGDQVRVDFALRIGGRIAGRVTGADGAPLAGVSVHFAESPTWPIAQTVKTGPDGTYETTGLPADKTWTVWTTDHSGLSGGTISEVAVAAGEVRRGVDFTLLPFGKFRVRFIDAVTGKPLARRMTVRVYDLAKPWHYYSPYALRDFWPNEDREISLPDGTYGMVATLSDLTGDFKPTLYPDIPCSEPCSPAHPVPVVSVPGTTQTLEFRIDAVGARIAGRVADAQSGAPLAGVILSREDGEGPSP